MREAWPFPRDDLDPFPFYQRMRDTYPVYRQPHLPRWDVFRYADVLRVLNSPGEFSSQVFTDAPQAEEQPLYHSIVFMDDPHHQEVRGLVRHKFTPTWLARFEPVIARVANDLLDTLVPSGEMDVVADFAYPLPMIVIAEVLGVPAEDRTDFKRWSTRFMTDEFLAGFPDVPEMHAYFRTQIAQRRKSPQDDLVSILANAHIGGKALPEIEIVGFLEFLLVAGYETTAHLLTNFFRVLDEYREQMDVLWRQPDLLEVALEEVLRFRAPVLFQFRKATRDVVLSGQRIEAGSMVITWLGSANRDERHFIHPESFNIERFGDPRKKLPDHVAFGRGGPHYCLGAPLARLEARIALSLVIQRMQAIERVGDLPLEAIASTVSGVKHFPVTFRAR